MASVFSSPAASFYSFSDPHDQLTQSRHANHRFRSPLQVLTASMTVELIRLLIVTIVKLSDPQCPSPLHGAAANDVGTSVKKPRRSL